MEKIEIPTKKNHPLIKLIGYGTFLTGVIHGSLDYHQQPISEHLETLLTYGPALATGIIAGIDSTHDIGIFPPKIPGKYNDDQEEKEPLNPLGEIIYAGIVGTFGYLITEAGYHTSQLARTSLEHLTK